MTRSTRLHLPVGRRGFSLIEMVISLAVISILLVGMTSAIVLASRALPSNDGPAAATVQSARALHQLRDELRAATQLLHRTATSVTLHLPDRDADGRPEVITYAWAGTPGDPLTRNANGDAAVNVIESVEDFSLAYVTADQATAFPGPPGGSSSEQLLSSFTTNGGGEHKLKDDDWVGTQIAPSLPTGTTTWQITRALFYGKKQGGSGSTITFELRDWNGNEPASNVLDSVDVAESTLGNQWAWQEAVFSGGVTFDADEIASIVLANHGGGEAGNWEYHDSGSAPTSMFNGDGNGGWSAGSDDEELLHYVYGTYQAPSDDWTYTRSRVTAVEVTLTHASAAATTHQLKLTLPNAPEAVDMLWEADFNADPTTLDGEADGQPDWKDEGPFDTANLNAGRWEVTDTVSSEPDGFALDTPFRFDVWLEDTTDSGNGGGVRLRFERDGGQQAHLVIQSDLDASGQVITVLNEDADAALVPWFNQTAPAGEPVRVSLAVDTANDTAAVSINGELVGSFSYDMITSHRPNLVRPFVNGSNSGVVIDHLRLATGGTATITPGAYDAGSGSSGSGSDLVANTGSGAASNTESTESSGSGGNWWENLFN